MRYPPSPRNLLPPVRESSPSCVLRGCVSRAARAGLLRCASTFFFRASSLPLPYACSAVTPALPAPVTPPHLAQTRCALFKAGMKPFVAILVAACVAAQTVINIYSDPSCTTQAPNSPVSIPATYASSPSQGCDYASVAGSSYYTLRGTNSDSGSYYTYNDLAAGSHVYGVLVYSTSSSLCTGTPVLKFGSTTTSVRADDMHDRKHGMQRCWRFRQFVRWVVQMRVWLHTPDSDAHFNSCSDCTGGARRVSANG